MPWIKAHDVTWRWSAARSRCAALTVDIGKATRPDWIAEHKINILVQIGLAKAKDLPDVPLLMDLGTTTRTQAACVGVDHIGGRSSPAGRAGRRCALRRAFDAMVHDPVFIEQARREKFDIDPSTGESMQQVVNEMMAIPKAQSERLQKIIE